MNEQNEAISDQNRAASETKIDPQENPALSLNHDGDRLTDLIEALPDNDP